MKLSPTTMQSAINGSAGAVACKSRLLAVGAIHKLGRRPCKPVCFKENDRIDDATTTRRTGTPSGTPTTPSSGPLYGTDMPSTAAIRAVDLGPVATVLYPLLSLGTAAASLAAMLAPGFVGSALFRGATLTATQKVLVFCAGAALIPSFVAKRRIQDAATSGTLASPTFKQMVSACLLHAVLGLVVLSQAQSLRNPLLGGTVGGLTGLAAITTAYTLMKIRESGQLVPSARGLLGGVLSLLSPRNLTATAYSLVTVGALAVGSMLMTVDPTTPGLVFLEPKAAIHVFACRMTGAATLAMGLLLFPVKQAADDGRQRSPVYRDINGGVAAYAALTTAALVYSLASGLAQPSPAAWAHLAFTGFTALLTAYNWRMAPA